MKSERENRERALLMKMEQKMQKQIKKQKGNKKASEDEGSDKEEESALVKALMHQQKELSNLVTNTRSKHEDVLLNENKNLMKKLE